MTSSPVPWLVIALAVSIALIVLLIADRKSRIELKCERERLKRYAQSNVTVWDFVDQQNALADEEDRRLAQHFESRRAWTRDA